MAARSDTAQEQSFRGFSERVESGRLFIAEPTLRNGVVWDRTAIPESSL